MAQVRGLGSAARLRQARGMHAPRKRSMAPFLLGYLGGCVSALLMWFCLSPVQARAGRNAAAAGKLTQVRVPAVVREVATELRDRQVEAPPTGDIFDRCLKSMASGFDRYSYYASPSERANLESFRRRGLDLGLTLAPVHRTVGDVVEVVAVVQGSRAEQLGVGVGDRVVAIAGAATRGLRRGIDVELRLAQLAVTKPKAQVELSLLAPGRLVPRRVSLGWRQRSPEASVKGRVLRWQGKSYYWLRIHEFISGTGHAFERQLARLRTMMAGGEVTGLVLDLRTNPGGDIDEALIVADAFLSAGLITSTHGRGGTLLRQEFAHPVTALPNLPVVVLQNRYTASAAELLALALKEQGRAKIVGERSFGKGTVQALHGASDGGLLALTIARYHGPSGTMIDGVGVEPDLPVHVHLATSARARRRRGLGTLESGDRWQADIPLVRAIEQVNAGLKQP